MQEIMDKIEKDEVRSKYLNAFEGAMVDGFMGFSMHLREYKRALAMHLFVRGTPKNEDKRSFVARQHETTLDHTQHALNQQLLVLDVCNSARTHICRMFGQKSEDWVNRTILKPLDLEWGQPMPTDTAKTLKATFENLIAYQDEWDSMLETVVKNEKTNLFEIYFWRSVGRNIAYEIQRKRNIVCGNAKKEYDEVFPKKQPIVIIPRTPKQRKPLQSPSLSSTVLHRLQRGAGDMLAKTGNVFSNLPKILTKPEPEPKPVDEDEKLVVMSEERVRVA
jgi:hypothetical protein